MIHAIVEGEPGIFPDPVARILRKVAGLFQRRRKGEAPAGDQDQPPEGPAPS